MKVITGLDWLEKIHYPEQLIDFCLNNVPVNEGCDIVDYIYVLYKCSEETDHRKRNSAIMIKAIEQIFTYVPEDKGFRILKINHKLTTTVFLFSKGTHSRFTRYNFMCVGLLMALKH